MIKHPANNEAFLFLPANNVQQAPANEPRTFGVHHLTVLTACQILTSETGFLSLSSDRENSEGVVSMDPDGILTLREYYYHLINPQTDPLYPICLDFSSWRFPHDQLPQAWERTASLDEDEIVAADSWSALSAAVKARDGRCRLSGWRDGITTAHIIPSEEGSWVSRKVNFTIPIPNTLRCDSTTCGSTPYRTKESPRTTLGTSSPSVVTCIRYFLIERNGWSCPKMAEWSSISSVKATRPPQSIIIKRLTPHSYHTNSSLLVCMGDYRTSKVGPKAWFSQAIPRDRPDLRIISKRAPSRVSSR